MNNSSIIPQLIGVKNQIKMNFHAMERATTGLFMNWWNIWCCVVLPTGCWKDEFQLHVLKCKKLIE